MTIYWLEVPSEFGFPIRLSVPIGAASGPPDGVLSAAPGVVTRTYFKGEPAPPGVPVPITKHLGELERVTNALLRWENNWNNEVWIP